MTVSIDRCVVAAAVNDAGKCVACDRSERARFAAMGLRQRLNAEAVKRKRNKIRGRQYLRCLFRYRVEQDEREVARACVWSDWGEHRRLARRH